MVSQAYTISTVKNSVPPKVKMSQYDSASRTITFTVVDGSGSAVSLTGKTVTVEGTRIDGHAFAAACTVSGSTATFTETVDMTNQAGDHPAELVVRESGQRLGTMNFIIAVEPAAMDENASITPEDQSLFDQLYTSIDDAEAEIGTAKDAALQQIAQGLASGSPLVANTVSEMTDTDEVYLYTGSESGYTKGSWYYYNGSAWVVGDVYGAGTTDTTLTLSGVAADAKATGDEISNLKSEISSQKPEYNPFINATVLDSALYYGYKAVSTSSWQGNYPSRTYPAAEGDVFTILISDFHGVGTQKARFRFLDSSDNVLVDRYPTFDANGNAAYSTAAPENSASVVVSVWTISSGGTVVVGQTYYFRNLFVFKGKAELSNLVVTSDGIGNSAVKYSGLSDNVKPYYIGLRYGVKYPNFNTATKTLTFYTGTCLFDRNATEIFRSASDIDVVCDTHSQVNTIVFDRQDSTFKAFAPNIRTYSDDYIVLGMIQIAGSANYPFGRGWIGIPHTIDGYDPYIKQLDPMLDLPSGWGEKAQLIQEAQETKITFAIQTDTHYALDSNDFYGNNLKTLTNYVGMDFVANLGDVIQGYAQDIDSNENARKAMTQIMRRYVTGISCPLLIAMGNHDDNSMWALANDETPLPFSEVWAREFKPSFNTMPYANTATGLMYYYVDFKDVRVIVLNTQDGNNGTFGIGATQITWLTDIALNTQKPILVFSHVPLINGWSVSSNYDSSYADAVTAIKAFQTNGGTVIACMSGHTHTQEYQAVNGILYVTFRNGASIAEAVMVDLDNKTISTIPIGFTGAGEREFTFS